MFCFDFLYLFYSVAIFQEFDYHHYIESATIKFENFLMNRYVSTIPSGKYLNWGENTRQQQWPWELARCTILQAINWSEKWLRLFFSHPREREKNNNKFD